MIGTAPSWFEWGLAAAIAGCSVVATWAASRQRFVFNDGARFTLRQCRDLAGGGPDVTAQSRDTARRFVLGATGGMFLLNGVLSPWVLFLVPETLGLSTTSRARKLGAALGWGATCAALVFLVPRRSPEALEFFLVLGVSAVSISLGAGLVAWMRHDLRRALVWVASTGAVATAATISSQTGVRAYVAEHLSTALALPLALLVLVVGVVDARRRGEALLSWHHALNATVAALASQGLFSGSSVASASLVAGPAVLAFVFDSLRRRAYLATIRSSVRISEIGSTVGLLSAVVAGLLLHAVLGAGATGAALALATGWLLSQRDQRILHDTERPQPDRRELIGTSALRAALDRAQVPSLAVAAVLATSTLSLPVAAAGAAAVLWAHLRTRRERSEVLVAAALALCAVLIVATGGG